MHSTMKLDKLQFSHSPLSKAKNVIVCSNSEKVFKINSIISNYPNMSSNEKICQKETIDRYIKNTILTCKTFISDTKFCSLFLPNLPFYVHIRLI